ncbi:hypothetical protein AB9F36_23795 [Rhizobium leguminosarum]|uniref:hypothetical protein n=1 Tax=Rhizobium leguminosarum TaxID=384 RepID=UPI003F9BCFF5
MTQKKEEVDLREEIVRLKAENMTLKSRILVKKAREPAMFVSGILATTLVGIITVIIILISIQETAKTTFDHLAKKLEASEPN